MSTISTPERHGGAPQGNLQRLIRHFDIERTALEVNFRELMPADAGPAKGAHGIHPYPARLLVNIPQFFLAALKPQAESLLLDPFCGSGTVLYEGMLSGLRLAGADSNPLARLITTAKLMPIERDVARNQLSKVMLNYSLAATSMPDVVNRDYWFSERIADCLGRLRSTINANVPLQHRPLFDVSFSATVRRVSYADPRLSVPVRINPERAARYGAKGVEVIRRLERLADIDVGAMFWSITSQNIGRCAEKAANTFGDELSIFEDARSIGLASGSVDLVITSPPYVGAQKYVRASSLSLGWLGMTPGCKLRPIEQRSIGREHLASTELLLATGTGLTDADAMIAEIDGRNPLRARIAQRYLLEMREAMTELARTVKPGGHLVLVVGPNLVAGLEFPTPSYLEQIAWSVGFTTRLHLVDFIQSRGLMTKRNRTAGVIQQESVFLLERTDTHA